MKKLVLIIGMILCIAIIGSVFAVAVYDANEKSTNVSTDDYLYVTLTTSASSGFTLAKGDYQVIPVVANLVSSTTIANTDKATLTVSVAETSGKSIEKVEVAIYSDAQCTTLASSTLVVDNIAATANGTTYYIRVALADNVTEADVNNAGGTITVTLAHKA